MFTIACTQVPKAIYFYLIKSNTLFDTWEKTIAQGMKDEYRCHWLRTMEYDQDSIKLNDFYNALRKGTVTKEEYSQYCFHIGKTKYWCFGVADDGNESSMLLGRFKEYAAENGLKQRYLEEIEALYNASEEQRQDTLSAVKTYCAWKL